MNRTHCLEMKYPNIVWYK